MGVILKKKKIQNDPYYSSVKWWMKNTKINIIFLPHGLTPVLPHITLKKIVRLTCT